MAAGDDDDPGVLGNLPRSRPGQRSAKRGSGNRAAGAAQQAKRSTSSGARKPAAARSSAARSSGSSRASGSSASSARGARSPRGGSAAPRPPKTTARTASSSSGPSDPLSQAVRLGVKVAETGVKTAVGLIRRLPGAR